MAVQLIQIPDGRWIQPAAVAQVAITNEQDSSPGPWRLSLLLINGALVTVSRHPTKGEAEAARESVAELLNRRLRWTGGL